jgi:hypothetical protein
VAELSSTSRIASAPQSTTIRPPSRRTPWPGCLRLISDNVSTVRRSASIAVSRFIIPRRGLNSPRATAGRRPAATTFTPSGSEAWGSPEPPLGAVPLLAASAACGVASETLMR